MGLNQIAMFEAKVSSGNGEQSLSRDVYRLGQLLDFFRMLSFFITSVGYYVCTMVSSKPRLLEAQCSLVLLNKIIFKLLFWMLADDCSCCLCVPLWESLLGKLWSKPLSNS